MMVLVVRSKKNVDFPLGTVGLDVGWLDVLTGSPGGFCSLPPRSMPPIPTCGLYVLSRVLHTGETWWPYFC